MALKRLTNLFIQKNVWLCIPSMLYKHTESIRYYGKNRNGRLDEVRRQCFPDHRTDMEDQNENYESEGVAEVDQNEEGVEQVMSTPSDYVESRTVRIYRRSTDPALQLGRKSNYTWEIDFDSNEGDDETNSHLKLEFPSAQAAINFINKHRWEWSLDAHQIYPYEPKTGGNTFWNNKNRSSTEE